MAGRTDKHAAKADPGLAEYARKRNFDITPEPGGEVSRARREASPQFVVQKHAARRLHYDFRLELEGSLKSWAVPKGPSLDPAVKRLAVQVEDHPLDYAGFEGHIPEGQYGGGDVIVWDRGVWQPDDADPAAAWRAGRLKFHLLGEKLSGGWALVRTRMSGSGDKAQWLLIKERDADARAQAEYDIVEARPESVLSRARLPPKATRAGTAKASRQAHGDDAGKAKAAAMPQRLAPELATLVDAPPAGDWRYELKFDGYRLLARIDGGAVRLFTRNGRDWSGRLAALAEEVAQLGIGSGWLDGEIVVLDERGVPDFQALQNAFESGRNGTADVVYFLFDIPWHKGRDLRAVPLAERRALLKRLLGRHRRGQVRYSEDFAARHGDLLRSACALELEGVIGKRADSPYVSRRSADWIKLKCKQRQEFVIGGHTAPQGRRSRFGALLLGVHDEAGTLRYAGRVGSGFSEASLRELHERMRRLARETPPFANPPVGAEARGVSWVEPQLICEVEFAAWTADGLVRQAVFRGLRADKPPREITRERAQAADAPKPSAGAWREAVGGVDISHPERVIDAGSGTTKRGLAQFYLQLAGRLLPHLAGRPLSILRAPAGVGGERFFQRHMEGARIPGLRLLDAALDPDGEPLMEIDNATALIGAVQMGTIEFHTWNAESAHIERPDRIVFDLDPDPALPWSRMIEATQLTLTLLDELGLEAWLKTSGGKGMHLVVPLARRDGWDALKAFAKAVSEHLAHVLPQRFTARMGPKNRVGRIFVDYLRNQRGASTVAAWSVRARPGLPVSVPIAREELERIGGADQWTITNLAQRLEAVERDPWAGYARTQRITHAMRAQLGME